MKLDLGLDADRLVSCVSCGLCLPHCPTYRVTGEEAASPRGRIALMRTVQEAGEATDAFVGFMDACVQCRGCETACPAGVQFGRLMEQTRAALADQTAYQPWWRRLGYRVLGRPRLLRAGSVVLALAQRARLVPNRLGLPRIGIRRPALTSTGKDVWLFTGCVMDAWMRETHVATKRLMEAAGVGVALPGAAAGCCGALHTHAGLAGEARALAARVMGAFPGSAPIGVDSAGCGAALKDYGHLVDTDEARRFSARVMDVTEWLATNVDKLPPPSRRVATPVAVQDPCHLRHVQLAHLATRDALRWCADLVELDDEGLCCGAGGAYSTLHPEMAADIRQRKLAAIERSGAPVVASANPGCLIHLANAGVDVRHPVEIMAECL
jgi:glycolate oxidase iron-sulfur subunit